MSLPNTYMFGRCYESVFFKSWKMIRVKRAHNQNIGATFSGCYETAKVKDLYRLVF